MKLLLRLTKGIVRSKVTDVTGLYICETSRYTRGRKMDSVQILPLVNHKVEGLKSMGSD